MKIITWNCNMAFRKKAGLILTHKPDIVIIPECEHPDKLKFTTGTPEPTDTLWFGTNLNKGLGIFSYSKFPAQDYERKTIILGTSRSIWPKQHRIIVPKNGSFTITA